MLSLLKILNLTLIRRSVLGGGRGKKFAGKKKRTFLVRCCLLFGADVSDKQ